MQRTDDDDALVARCLAGDNGAFRPLVERYQRVLFTVALRMLGNEEDAKDAAQTAFVKAYEKLGTFDRSHRFFSWIYRILLNECLNQRRDRRWHEPLDLAPPVPPDGDDRLAAIEARARVQTALMRLSPLYREVIVLRHFAELSYREMAGVLRVPEVTVKSRLYTARQRLGELLLDPTAS